MFLIDLILSYLINIMIGGELHQLSPIKNIIMIDGEPVVIPLLPIVFWVGACISRILTSPPDFKYEIALKEEIVEIRFKKQARTFNREKLEMSEKNENSITITDGVEKVKLPYSDEVLYFLGFLKRT